MLHTARDVAERVQADASHLPFRWAGSTEPPAATPCATSPISKRASPRWPGYYARAVGSRCSKSPSPRGSLAQRVSALVSPRRALHWFSLSPTATPITTCRRRPPISPSQREIVAHVEPRGLQCRQPSTHHGRTQSAVPRHEVRVKFVRHRIRPAVAAKSCAPSARATDGSSRRRTSCAWDSGRVVGSIELAGGLDAAPSASRRPRSRTSLIGDDGPTGTGIVAFGSLPFDRRRAAASLTCPSSASPSSRPATPG